MEIMGKANNPVNLDEIVRIVARVSEELYAGNLIVHRNARQISSRSVRARLSVLSSRESGARRSWTGRRMPAACWHAYRDGIRAILTRYPEATIRTAMARYAGLTGFEEAYPATAYRNIGSAWCPAYMPDLCDCADAPQPVLQRIESKPAPIPTPTIPATPEPIFAIGDTVRHEDGWTGEITDIIDNPWPGYPRILAIKEPDGYSGDWHEDVFTRVD